MGKKQCAFCDEQATANIVADHIARRNNFTRQSYVLSRLSRIHLCESHFQMYLRAREE